MTDLKKAGLEETNAMNVAALDGMIEPDVVAQATVRGMSQGQFMIYPHQQVHSYFQHRANDPERWIKGMQRLNHKEMNHQQRSRL
jgi:hypothetical protein